MPRIYDNIEENGHFIETIQHIVLEASRGDFCVDNSGLRGYKAFADTLNRSLKAGTSDEPLANLVVDLITENRLCVVSDGAEAEGVRIVCGFGVIQHKGSRMTSRRAPLESCAMIAKPSIPPRNVRIPISRRGF